MYHNNNNTNHAGSRLEHEGDDRSDIDLPGNQLQLLQDASESASSKYYNVIDITINNYVLCNNKDTVLILYNAGPLDVSWAVSSDKVVAILDSFLPGQVNNFITMY